MYSLPKLCKSSFDHCCSGGGCVGIAYCLPHPPGFKAQSMAGEIPAVSGWLSGIFCWSTSTAEGCCLATGGDLLVVCSQCMLHLNLQHYRTCDIFLSGICIK